MTTTCITATLIRGKIYSYNHVLKKAADGSVTDSKFHQFIRGQPLQIHDPSLADELEELMHIEVTRDGDEIEKPMFKIDRNAPVRTKEAIDPNKRVRMRLVAADQAKTPRPKPNGLYKRTIGQ